MASRKPVPFTNIFGFFDSGIWNVGSLPVFFCGESNVCFVWINTWLKNNENLLQVPCYHDTETSLSLSTGFCQHWFSLDKDFWAQFCCLGRLLDLTLWYRFTRLFSDDLVISRGLTTHSPCLKICDLWKCVKFHSSSFSGIQENLNVNFLLGSGPAGRSHGHTGERCWLL